METDFDLQHGYKNLNANRKRKINWSLILFFVCRQIDNASASQSSNKRENKLEASGSNKSRDIRIENFDLSYAER